jgi:predicted Rossmann fold flavoprotein
MQKTKKAANIMYDVIVIGGGASGMTAAGRAAELGKRVLLLEKNKKLGEKLAISGGGRCNITNAQDNEKQLLSNYGKAEQFLYSPFTQFGMRDTFSFFEKIGLPLKVEVTKRAFPETEKATDVVRVLKEYMAKGNVEVYMGKPVEKIGAKAGCIQSVTAGGLVFEAKSYILATGGVSHPETGSTGDGFNWLSGFGHTVFQPTPTIVPLAVKDAWVKELKGVTLKGAKISFFIGSKKQFSSAGDILLTHFGLSGPTILNSAGKVADLLYVGPVTAIIDTYPTFDIGALDAKIVALFAENKNKLLRTLFKELAPAGASDALFKMLDIDAEVKVHSVSKTDRRKIIDLLKALPVTITGLMGFDRAVVADGGIPLAEIDMKTMKSAKIENLYITGDLLDITRPSGGYSLQLCWTTGFIAGSNA